LVREIDREGALNAELYMSTEFLRSKKVTVDPNAESRVQELTKQALSLCEERLKTKPDDVDALYARGVARSLSAMYEGLIDKSWYSAFRNALGAYRDHKRVLELSPNYADAKLVVGVYEYIVAALPLYERLAAYLFSVKGNKAEGLNYIREAADAGGEASVDAKTALALFLVREHQYPEALSLIRELYHAYPHNFHYGQSEGNALRDAGNFSQAAAVYRNLLALTQRNMFPHPHPASLAINLGRTLRSMSDYRGAAAAFESVDGMPGTAPEEISRAKLQAGEMYDLLHERDTAIPKYREVIAMEASPTDVSEAKSFLKHAYH
jgi:tetratricopeptide (TPR) repeat protein